MTTKITALRLIQEDEIRRAYSLLTGRSGQVVEIRALEASFRDRPHFKQTIGGFFDNANDLVTTLRQIVSAQGIYITLQELDPDLLHRAKNKLIAQKKDYSTPDKNVKRYRWLPLDCDIVRSVKLISSSEEEHALALGHAQRVKQFLLDHGWPEPIEADSGNGAHLLLPVDLPVNEETSDLLKRVLAGIAQQTDSERIHLDQTVFNPARIWKFYGTLVCKGDNTNERPHRMSRLLYVPENLTTVTQELLEQLAVAKETPVPVKAVRSSASSKGEQTLEDFLSKHGIAYTNVTRSGQVYHILTSGCVFDNSHKGQDAAVFQKPSGEWCYKCFHESCGNKGWKEFRLHFEPDAYTEEPVTAKKKVSQAEGEQEEAKKEPSTQQRLMAIAEYAHYIKTPSGALYARVPIRGHHEVVSINEKGSGFRRWLVYLFHKIYGFAPNSDALSQVMASVQALAEYEGEKAKVHSRIAEKDGHVYLDLANEKWECVEISAQGWKVISCPPVYFRRPNGMLPLPVPTRGGDLQELRQLINAKTEKDYILIYAWLIGALHPSGPYPVLNLNGERGSAKTFTSKVLRNLIDPNEAPTRNSPKDDREAAIAAQNNMVYALDNLSSMPLWLSDVLCKISTGAGYGTRELYSDDNERIFNNTRPIILNGIEDGLITQGDLLNRTMLVTLEPPKTYRSEKELNELFRSKHPALLGALLSIVAHALRTHETVHLEHPPRMADFALWMTAAEPMLKWKRGTFLEAYTENQDNASSIITESSPVAKAIIQFMDNHKDGWSGLVSQLLIELQKYEVYEKAKTAPKSPNKLSGQLKRVAPALRIQGIDIQTPPRKTDGCHIELAYVDKASKNVDKTPDYVDKTPDYVDKKILSTCSEEAVQEPFDDGKSQNYVDHVDTSASLSGTLSSALVEKKERIEEVKKEKEETPDREGNLSTLSTQSSKLAEKVSVIASPTGKKKLVFRI